MKEKIRKLPLIKKKKAPVSLATALKNGKKTYLDCFKRRLAHLLATYLQVHLHAIICTHI